MLQEFYQITFLYTLFYGKIMQKKGLNPVMKKLFPYLKPFRKQCMIGPICKLIEAILELILPTIMAFMINQGVLQHDRKVVFTYGIFMILMVFVGFGFSIVCQYNAAIASQGFGTAMRNRLFAHVMKFSYEDIDRFGQATLINRIGNDVNQLQVAVAMLIRLVIRSPFIVLGAIVMSMLMDVRLSLILLGTVPLIALTLFWFIRTTTPLYKIYQRKLDTFINVLSQNLSGVRVIRAFLSQRQETNRMQAASEDLQIQMMQVAKISALLNPITALIINGAIVLLLWNGIISIPQGDISAGTLVAFINYATQILLALVAVSNLIVIFTKAAASAQRVNEILEVTPSMQYGMDDEILDVDDALSLHHVEFTYPHAQRPSLSDIDICIKAGAKIGVIGGTGSGKSTLAALLCGFYRCDNIQLFGKDIARYSKSALTRLITLIPQKNELFSGTLRENLQYGNPAADDAMLWEALTIAQAAEFVFDDPRGLDKPIEASGNNLSGGQRQRICIARGLLRQSRILIFDDSFSALDFKTDAQLRHELSKQNELTQIIISQRVGTIMGCDRILVLDNGHIAGFATHQELLQTCSIYQEICTSQNMGKENGVCAQAKS